MASNNVIPAIQCGQAIEGGQQQIDAEPEQALAVCGDGVTFVVLTAPILGAR